MPPGHSEDGLVPRGARTSASAVSGRRGGPGRLQSSPAASAVTDADIPAMVKAPATSDFEVLKPPLQSRPTNTADPKTARPVSVTLEALQKQWEQIVVTVKKQKIALGSFLQDGVPWKLVGNVLEIAFDPKTRFHMEHVQKNRTAIERIFARDLELPLRIRCVEKRFNEAGIVKKIHSPEEILEDIKNKEPVLNRIIELFDCTEAPDME